MGLLIASSIMTLWLSHLYYCLAYMTADFANPVFYFHILIQAYLFTGLFITSHDAMHGNVTKNKFLNKITGQIACFLFAGFSYRRLVKNHFKHHSSPASEDDPDFDVHSQNFFVWWIKFMLRYTTLSQIIIMAFFYNLLEYFFTESNVIFFWLIPAFLSTLQLFYFGTYLPHRNPEKGLHKPHYARSQKKNHLLAMISCYFFGYHFEHHDSPKTPWWQLYKII